MNLNIDNINKCSVCENLNMCVYYKDFNNLIYYCNECCHFQGEIIHKNENHLFIEFLKFKIHIDVFVFYARFYDPNSYLILDQLDIKKEIKKILNYIKKQNTDVKTIYIMCKSYDNVYNSDKGIFNFYSTNSMKYIGSVFNLNLINVYVLPVINKTIYEFKIGENETQYINSLLYKEIEYGLYKI
jgi:hypothetical protein